MASSTITAFSTGCGPNTGRCGRRFRRCIRGFNAISAAALSDGALSRKVKALIAMTIGVVHGCDGCIASHAKGAVRAGATEQEAAEAIAVGIMMHGGPATVYGARAFSAIREFSAETVTT